MTATLDAKSACSDVDFVIVVALINIKGSLEENLWRRRKKLLYIVEDYGRRSIYLYC